MFAEALEPYSGRLLIACSGGADSVALAHCALVRAKEQGTEMPHLAYIDHGLRTEAQEEGQAVSALAAGFAAPAHVVRIQVAAQASLEAAARDARYQALERLAEEHKIDWILLGHTSSDQVETILMRILRGTGLVGLAGMPKERGAFARPFLGLERQDTERYCAENDLLFAEDPMNRDERFTRVRMRHHWLPRLREENPRMDAALLGLGHAARDHREVLDWAAESHLDKHLATDGTLALGPEFRSLPSALATRVLVLHAAKAGVYGLERRHLKDLLALARAEEAGTRSLSFPGGRVRRSYAILAWNPAATVGRSVDPVPGHHARVWRPGDRMRPERLKGRSRKLSDLYTDAKIPKELRSRAQVLERTSDGEIVWAEHIGRAFDSEVFVTLRQEPDERAK